MGSLSSLALAISLFAVIATGVVAVSNGALGVLKAQNRVTKFVSESSKIKSLFSLSLESAVRVNVYPSLSTAQSSPGSTTQNGAALRLILSKGPSANNLNQWTAYISREGTNLVYRNQNNSSWIMDTNVSAVTFTRSGGLLVARVTKNGITHEIWTAIK